MPPIIFSISRQYVLWEAVSQTKSCSSPKIKHFVPQKDFGLATPPFPVRLIPNSSQLGTRTFLFGALCCQASYHLWDVYFFFILGSHSCHRWLKEETLDTWDDSFGLIKMIPPRWWIRATFLFVFQISGPQQTSNTIELKIAAKRCSCAISFSLFWQNVDLVAAMNAHQERGWHFKVRVCNFVVVCRVK